MGDTPILPRKDYQRRLAPVESPIVKWAGIASHSIGEVKNLRPFAMLRVTFDSLAAGDTEDAHAAHEGAGMPALVVGYSQLDVLDLSGGLFGFALNLLVYLVDFPDATSTDRVTE